MIKFPSIIIKFLRLFKTEYEKVAFKIQAYVEISLIGLNVDLRKNGHEWGHVRSKWNLCVRNCLNERKSYSTNTIKSAARDGYVEPSGERWIFTQQELPITMSQMSYDTFHQIWTSTLSISKLWRTGVGFFVCTKLYTAYLPARITFYIIIHVLSKHFS